MAHAGIILEIFRVQIQSCHSKLWSLVRSHFKQLAHPILLSIRLEGECLSLTSISLTESPKSPNSPCPLALPFRVTKGSHGYLYLLLRAKPLDNPKSTAFPDAMLQKDAPSREYDLFLMAQVTHSPQLIPPCIF